MDAFRTDLEAMCALVADPATDLFAAIPQGDGGYLLSGRKTLLTGADKADWLHNVLSGDSDPLHMPSQIASPEMVWYIDKAAAARLQG